MYQHSPPGTLGIFEVLRNEIPIERLLQVNGHRKIRCISPSHEDRNPSMAVFEDHVHCYGCSFHGDVVNVWQAKKGIRSSLEAARDLAREYEVQLPEMSSEGRERLQRERMEQDLHLATAKEANVRLSKKRKVRQWWESRGFTEDLRNRFILGASEDGKAAVIPMHHRGRVLGLIYRNLSGKTKYVLPPSDELPGGYKPLFIPAPLSSTVILTEGYVDALAAAAADKAVIAVGGTSLSEEQLRDLKRLLPRDGKVFVMTDDDDAGRKAARDWSRTLYPVAMVCSPSYGEGRKDIGDLMENLSTDEVSDHLERLISNAADPVDIESAALKKKTADEGLTVRKQLEFMIKNIVPLIAKLEPAAMRSATSDMVRAENPALQKKWFNDAIAEQRGHMEQEFIEGVVKEAQEKARAEQEEYEALVKKAQPLIDERIGEKGVLERLRDTAAAIHEVEGDARPLALAILVALGAQLDVLPNGKPTGTSVLLTAPSGRGKNFLFDAACELLPEHFFYAFEVASGQSFYYRIETEPDFLQHTFLYPNEIEGAEQLWAFLRPMLTKGEAEKQVSAKGPDGNITVEIIKVRGPITLAIPTIRNKTDEQMQTRLLIAELPDYEGRVKAHSQAISRQLHPDAYKHLDYEKERWLWSLGLEQLTKIRKVVIPLKHPDFALDDDKLAHGARTWGNLLSLMITHAWLEQRNRNIIEVAPETLAVEATADDYEVAYDIFVACCKRTIVNLSEAHRKILNGLYKLETDHPERDGFVYSEISEAAGVSRSTISDNKSFLIMNAKLMKDTENGLRLLPGAEKSWWEDTDLTKGLPTPEKVRAWWDEQWPDGGGGVASPQPAEQAEQPNKGGGADPKADRQGDSDVRPPAEHAPNAFGDDTPAERVRPLFGEQPNAQNGIDKPDSPSTEEDVRLFGGFDAAEHTEHAEQTSLPTTVVNVYSGQPYGVYGGRGPGGTVPKSGRSMWGNPFIEGLDGTRDEVIEMYDRYLDGPVANYKGEVFDGRHLRPLIPSLRGKVIGCHCKPKPCHCDVLAERADREDP